MSGNTELTLTPEDYDKAFTEVSFLLDIFIETLVTFVGKSTPSLAVAAGRKMAGNLPVHMTEKTPQTALAELVRVLKIQQMDIEGRFAGPEAVIEMDNCPIGSVCKNQQLEIGGQACQMFHYYIAGIMAELCGYPTRPKTIATGDRCSFSLAFSGLRPAA